jgi:hypothetical protein
MTVEHVSVNVQASLTLLGVSIIILKGRLAITRNYPVRGSAVSLQNCSNQSSPSGLNFMFMTSSINGWRDLSYPAYVLVCRSNPQVPETAESICLNT